MGKAEKRLFAVIYIIILCLFVVATKKFKIIEFLNTNVQGVLLWIAAAYLLYRLPLNILVEALYKRDRGNNDKRYSAKRCYEDNPRDNIYLVDEADKKFHRINLYTLERLNYPRPSRDDDECFKISDRYTIGNEIKIYNTISNIKEVFRIKDKDPNDKTK